MQHDALKMKSQARELRRQQTPAENALWNLVRNRGLLDLKFRRQVEVGRYILDFYCEELKLAIELDGASHLDPNLIARDSARTEWLQARGITVLRVENEELLLNGTLVLARINNVVAGLRKLARARDPHP